MSGVAVERVCAAHLFEVAELERLCFAEPWSEQALAQLLTEDAVGYVCVRDGCVLAYGGMLIAPFEGQVTNVAVHPDARRQGLGKRVTEALIRDAEERGLEQIALEVRASNAAAIALYESLGFAVAGRRKNFYRRPAEDALVMLKPISKSLL